MKPLGGQLKTFQLLTSIVLAAAVVSCAPSAKQLKEAIEKDPSIVYVAIEKDPKGFFETVKKAQEGYAKKAQEDMMQDEQKKRDAEFSNPLKPEVQDGRVVFGPKNAKITIVEYSDFECPYCSRGYETVKQVLKAYPKDVRVVFKHLPLDFHPKALPAAKYFEAIAKQDHGKAEKFHDAIFQNQDKLKKDGETYLKSAAKALGVDMKKLEKDLNDATVMAHITSDMEEAKKFEISGTPGFIINGVSLKGAYPFEEFKQIIDRHLQK
jgi:protein-disulfide isomerase